MNLNSNPDYSESKAGEVLLISLLVLAQILLICKLLQDRSKKEPEKSQTLVIASLPLEQVQGQLSPYGPGFERELVQYLAQETGLKPRWRIFEDWKNCLQAFLKGRADLLIAPGFNSRELESPKVQAGPKYQLHQPLLLHNKYRFGLREENDICRFNILLSQHPLLSARLQAKAENLQCATELQTQRTPRLRKTLELLEDNQARFALVDSGRFRFWEPFFTDLRRTEVLNFEIPYRWYWTREKKHLDQALQEFWQDLQKEPRFQRLKERYWGFFPDNTDYFQLIHLQNVVQKRVPRYQGTILKAAKENSLDPLFLVAMIYQESAFVTSARSRTGVRGLLQLTQNTAREMGIQNRMDPRQSILGGARYLKQLWERLDSLQVSGWDRWFLALGAYNKGMTHVHNAIALAEKLGNDLAYWYHLKTIYPKLSYKEYYTQAPHGYARGYEVVDYVQSIRYYYYLLQGLSVLSGPEADQLAPFLANRPLDWPG
ncbi:MAG: transglycosylase SLT domain-containing protein [Thermodesulfobacteriota bacterium]